MENNTEAKVSPSQNRNPEGSSRKKPVLLIILVVVLSLVLAYLIYENSTLYKDRQELMEVKAELERQKTNLENELRNIYSQYDSLKTENDTINKMLAAEQQKIESLLKINANNVYKIRLYEKELETIRQVLRSYVVQIDSLNQANIALRSENIEVKQQLDQTRQEREELAKEKEQLTETVKMASVLSAKNIVVHGLNKRGREKDRINRIEKVRVCFTLRENAVVEPGEKIVYIRIARPDEVILTSGLNFFEFEGEQIIYSASREVSYENVDVDMCIYWTNDGQLIPGEYHVAVFCEGKNIGTTSFTFK